MSIAQDMTIDPTCGRSDQAVQFLPLLNADIRDRIVDDLLFDTTNQDFLTLHTGLWDNGRERGYVVSLGGNLAGPVRHYAWFEHRNSDNLCLLIWQTDQMPTQGWSSPQRVFTVDDLPPGTYLDKWSTTDSFEFRDFNGLSGRIVTDMITFLTDQYLTPERGDTGPRALTTGTEQ